MCGTTIVQAIALSEATDEVALSAAAVPAGTLATSAVNDAMLPLTAALIVVVRRVRPAGVVQVRAVLDLSTQ